MKTSFPVVKRELRPVLTEAEKRVFDAAYELKIQKGYPPSFSEIAKKLGVTTNTVRYAMERLRRKKVVTWTKNQSRTLKLNLKAMRELPMAVTSKPRVTRTDIVEEIKKRREERKAAKQASEPKTTEEPKSTKSALTVSGFTSSGKPIH